MKISRAVENVSEFCNRYENTYQLCVRLPIAGAAASPPQIVA
jgi:hypothetical protein